MSSSYNPKFDAFDIMKTDEAIAVEYCRPYNPVSTLASGSVIEFNIPPSNLSFIDLQKTRLKIRLSIKKSKDGSPIDKECIIIPIVNSFDSAFRSIDLQFQNTDMNNGVGANWPYKAYTDLLLTKNKDFTESQGIMQGFILDTPGQLESTNPETNQNYGLRQRWFYVKDTGSVELSGFLNLDAFNIDRFLPSGINVRLKLYPSRPDFYLMLGDSGDYYFEIEQATLYIFYVNPTDKLFVSYNEALSQKTAIFKYPKSTLKSFVVSKDVTSAQIDNVITDQVPNTILMFMTLNKSYSGNFKFNPMNFQLFKLDYVSLRYEGVEVGGYALTPNFSDEFIEGKSNFGHNFADSYFNLFLNKGLNSQGNLISPEGFRRGFFILRWDITEDIRRRPANQDNNQGLTRLSLKFKEALPEPISVIIYTQTHGYFAIDKERNVILSPEQTLL